MFGPSYFGTSYFGPTYFPPGSAVESGGGTGKKEPPLFITNVEEKRQLDAELDKQRELDLKRDLEARQEQEISQKPGLTEAQKLELIAFLEKIHEDDREDLLKLAEDEILAIMLLMN